MRDIGAAAQQKPALATDQFDRFCVQGAIVTAERFRDVDGAPPLPTLERPGIRPLTANGARWMGMEVDPLAFQQRGQGSESFAPQVVIG